MRTIRGLTLVELVIVVAVVAVLAAIAIPAYTSSRERTQETACHKNRQLFEQAKQLWMVDQSKTPDQEVYFRDLLPEYIAEPPICPSRGQYELHGLASPTTCSVHGT